MNDDEVHNIEEICKGLGEDIISDLLRLIDFILQE